MISRKKIVFCTYPSVYSSIVLQTILESPNIEISAIIASERNLTIKENKLVSDLKRIKHSGIRYALYLWLVTSGYNLGSKLTKQRTIENIALQNKIPILRTSNINNPEIISVIQKLSPDIILCAHFNQLISSEFYTLASEVALNIHPSLLPDLKGVDPGFYALYENYQETGVTLHKLAEHFDEGATIKQLPYKVSSSDTLFSINYSLFMLGAELVLDYLHDPNADNSNMNIQKNICSRYDSWPITSQVNAFRNKRKLISYQDLINYFT